MSLINPVAVWIRQKETRTPPAQSARLGQPMGQSFHKKERVKLRAQIMRQDKDRPSPTNNGVVEHSLGYLVFDLRELRDAGVTLQRDDMVVQMGEEPYADMGEYYLTEVEPFGHYASMRGSRYAKYYFTDQAPKYRNGPSTS